MKLINKIFSILLPILVLAFTQYPCTDGFDMLVSAKQINSNVPTVATQHTLSSLQIDNCSPFCVCACCSASLFTITALDLYIPIFKSQIAYTPTYYQHIPSGVYVSIWQPPKIA